MSKHVEEVVSKILPPVLWNAEPGEPLVFKRGDWTSQSGLLLLQLMRMPPLARLTRNMKVLLDIMSHGPVQYATRDGVTKAEYALMLESQQYEMPTRVAVYELLNIHERMEALDVFVEMYKKQKKRRREYEN